MVHNHHDLFNALGWLDRLHGRRRGETDTEVFRAYVQEVLCPTLRTGDMVIMDNLSPHKSTQTIELIQQVGAQVLFLPPNSPDLISRYTRPVFLQPALTGYSPSRNGKSLMSSSS